MRMNFNGQDYIITDMIVIDNSPISHMRYNVFDDKYKFVTSISCEDEIEFIKLFNNFLKQNK